MLKDLAAQIDRLLRGHYTRREDLTQGRIEAPVKTLVHLGLVLGAIYGAFMGLYALFRPTYASFPQFLATVVKVPLLFLLTLAVTFPSLYVFSALANSRLGSRDTLRLLLVAVSVNLALLASFGPVTGFFTLSTDSYPFMVTLNVLFFAASGFVGLAFLRRALEAVFEPPPATPPVTEEEEEAPPEKEEGSGEEEESRPERPAGPPRFRPPAPRVDPQAVPRRIFLAWTVIYGIVGAQMSWVLRPFIGTPDMPFTLFRARESSFFESFLHTLGRLFS
jgi:hypothetical protein